MPYTVCLCGSSNRGLKYVIMQKKQCLLFNPAQKKVPFFFWDACFAAGRSSACLLPQRSPLVSTGTLPRKRSLKAATEQLPSKQPLNSSLRIHKGCTRSLGDLKVIFFTVLKPTLWWLCIIFIHFYCLFSI